MPTLSPEQYDKTIAERHKVMEEARARAKAMADATEAAIASSQAHAANSGGAEAMPVD